MGAVVLETARSIYYSVVAQIKNRIRGLRIRLTDTMRPPARTGQKATPRSTP